MVKPLRKHKSKPLLYIQQPNLPDVHITFQDKLLVRVDTKPVKEEIEQGKETDSENTAFPKSEVDQGINGQSDTELKKETLRGERVPQFFPDSKSEEEKEDLAKVDESVAESEEKKSVSDKGTVHSTGELDAQRQPDAINGSANGTQQVVEVEDTTDRRDGTEEEGGVEVSRSGETGERISEIDGNREEWKEAEPSLKETIRRLAVYPRVLQRPYCEAIIRGKRKQFQVLSKRGDKVRIKVKNKIETYDIADFSHFKVLKGIRR